MQAIKSFVLVLVFLLLGLPSLWSYSPRDFVNDIVADTKERFADHLYTGYLYDAEERNGLQSKIAIHTPLFAYKFITVNPVWVYTPAKSDEVGEIGIAFPISIKDIPLGDGLTLRKWLEEETTWLESTGKWLDRLSVGFYFSHNFISERFGYGLMANVKLF